MNLGVKTGFFKRGVSEQLRLGSGDFSSNPASLHEEISTARG